MLSISTKYAIKALSFLAKQRDDGFLSVDYLSEKTGVPRPYLAKLVKNLANHRIVITKKGISGGVKLNRQNAAPTIYDVCVALDDPLVRNICFMSKSRCGEKSPCRYHSDWSAAREPVLRFLKDSTIE
jgi:Rrf2 family iron-sulfur cluster assembly transcriptional regulator